MKISLNFSIFPIALFLIFFIMKVASVGVVADWSWWLVTMPLWFIPLSVFAVLIFSWFLFFVILNG